MNVRDMRQSDVAEIQAIHAKRPLGFELPDLGKKLAVAKVLATDDRVVMAAILRPTTEAYVLVDREWETPWLRWHAFQKLHGDVIRECREQGIEDTHAFICPQIAKSFGRKLTELGWWRHDSIWYSRRAAD